MQASQTLDHPHRLIARAAAVVGLLGISLIHLLDLQSKLDETPYLGVAYLVLIAAALVTAALLVHADDRRAWASATVLALLTILGYVVNRSVGMPSATDDIGNWLEPLGLASLFVEAITAAICIYGLVESRSSSTGGDRQRSFQTG
ncbi:MAG: hypothetical protein M3137_06060 [Actinomycetota bacterium]|nr:hypothetical protein [Actinomycetota bacterium]